LCVEDADEVRNLYGVDFLSDWGFGLVFGLASRVIR
jgi:hypothetical protein